MNSEKVKEIKESLQQEIHLTEYVDRAYAETVSLDLLKDVLTLINELEKEVEDRKAEVLHLQEYGKKLIRETELKQFAERLKEKAHKGASRNPITYKFIERDYTITESELNELLKEYENE